MPFFADLTGDASDVIEGQDLTAQKIESKKDQSATFRRAQMWSATDLSAQLAGADPMKAIGTLVGAYWARELQKDLFSNIKRRIRRYYNETARVGYFRFYRSCGGVQCIQLY